MRNNALGVILDIIAAFSKLPFCENEVFSTSSGSSRCNIIDCRIDRHGLFMKEGRSIRHTLFNVSTVIYEMDRRCLEVVYGPHHLTSTALLFSQIMINDYRMFSVNYSWTLQCFVWFLHFIAMLQKQHQALFALMIRFCKSSASVVNFNKSYRAENHFWNVSNAESVVSLKQKANNTALWKNNFLCLACCTFPIGKSSNFEYHIVIIWIRPFLRNPQTRKMINLILSSAFSYGLVSLVIIYVPAIPFFTQCNVICSEEQFNPCQCSPTFYDWRLGFSPKSRRSTADTAIVKNTFISVHCLWVLYWLFHSDTLYFVFVFCKNLILTTVFMISSCPCLHCTLLLFRGMYVSALLVEMNHSFGNRIQL